MGGTSSPLSPFLPCSGGGTEEPPTGNAHPSVSSAYSDAHHPLTGPIFTTCSRSHRPGTRHRRLAQKLRHLGAAERAAPHMALTV
mmetsp:Transcript_80111/g.110900  ORF Transcript_80111/g.110900 Transcript_80111/m.110900 type:complete len:85 (-) Transcript_80111:27-281(-)